MQLAMPENALILIIFISSFLRIKIFTTKKRLFITKKNISTSQKRQIHNSI